MGILPNLLSKWEHQYGNELDILYPPGPPFLSQECALGTATCGT